MKIPFALALSVASVFTFISSSALAFTSVSASDSVSGVASGSTS